MRKKGHAVGIMFIALCTLALIAAGVGTPSWAIATLFDGNCTVTRTFGLFVLTDSYKEGCTLSTSTQYDVYCSDLVNFNHGLQYAVITFYALSMLICLIVMAIAGFNICENPYQTCCTPFGLAIYNVVGLVSSLIAVILYIILLYTNFDEPLNFERAEELSCGSSNIFGSESYEVGEPTYFGYSFYIAMCSLFTYCGGVALSISAERRPMTTVRRALGQESEVIKNPTHDAIIY